MNPFSRSIGVRSAGGFLAELCRFACYETHADVRTTRSILNGTGAGDIGVGPWQVTTNAISFPASGTLKTYGIELQHT